MKYTIFIFILATLAVSAVQYRFPVVRESKLKGFFSKTPPPELKYFTWKRWFSQDFQQVYQARANEHLGFRNSLIRIRNQYDYTFFGIIHAEGFVMGRQQCLYEEDYIHEYTGEFFIGATAIDKKLSRLRNVRDSLRAHGVPLLLVFEPGKASFYPEYIPGYFHPGKRTQTNYDYMLQRSKELGLDYLDLQGYFMKMKDTSRYALFPRNGMHWSLYAVPFAVDTLAKSIEKLSGTKLPRFKTTQLIHSDSPLGTDNDIGELLNLVLPLNKVLGVYPLVAFDSTPKTVKLLVIADSYYGSIVEDYGKHIFKSQDYWYYNKNLYPYLNFDPPVYADKSNLLDKLENYDAVVLMVSEINLHCGFWNFADEAFIAFHPEVKDPFVYGFENDIRNDRSWFRFMVKKARFQGRPLDELIREDAGYTFCSGYDNLPGKTYWDSIYHLTYGIRFNPEWFAQVTQKAKDRKISLDSMMLLDAIYSYDQSKKKQ